VEGPPQDTRYRPASEETKGWSVSSPGKIPTVVEGPFELPPSTSGPLAPSQQPAVTPTQTSPPAKTDDAK
jgi:hypothetical protein